MTTWRTAAYSAVLRFLQAGLLVVGLVGAALPARAEPIVLTDIMGREVTLQQPASRIVLGAGRHLMVLGLLHPDPASLVVGWRSDFKRDTASYAAWSSRFPAIDSIAPVAGAAGEALSAESVAALDPDLVILTLYDAEAAGVTQSIELLDRLGIPTIVLDFFSHPLENSLPSLRILGQAIGQPEKAEAFIAFYNQHLERIRTTLGNGPVERPTVFMHAHAGGTPCCSSPGHGIFTDMIELAGGENIALRHLDGLYGDISLEQLLIDDPDLYIATGGAHLAARGGLVLGTGTSRPEARESFAKLIATPGIADLTAVREGRASGVWHMFNDSPVHIVFVERLAKLFHPEMFKDLDPQATIDAINRDFLAVPMAGTYWIEP